MKYIRMLCFAAVLFVLTGAVFAAEPAESLTLDCTEQTLYTGNSVRVAATVAPKGASRRLNWSSSNPAVASVNSEGIVRGKTAGICTVTCSTTDGSGVQAELAVTVLEKVQQVRIEEQPANLLLGNDPATGRKQLTLSVFPQDASIRTVTWTSDKPGIATVDENGVVTAVAAGSCVITAKTNDPGSRASGRC
ncbi:MAG: Ig-like domain-containing protein, partial [Clostridia bacterium]|nr:Ig-like domain-containing protein [Clostridia bacterium]